MKLARAQRAALPDAIHLLAGVVAPATAFAWPRLSRIAAWFAMAAVPRLVLLLQPMALLDRLFIPDDTYYSLSIARQIALHGTPSTDGVIATNGFQPLITLLQVPLFLFHLSPGQAVFAAIAMSAFFGAACVAALATLAALSAGEAAGWTAALIAAMHPIILKNDLSGMETSLAGLLGVACVIATAAAVRPSGWQTRYALGLVFGAALLARVDLVFIVAPCLAYLAWCAGPRAAARAAAGMLSIVLPWAIWIYAATGAVFPESGRAVRQLIVFHQTYDIGTLATNLLAFCALGRIIPIDDSVSLHAAVAGVATLAGLLIAAVRLAPGPARLFLICALALGGTYFLYLPAFWFLSRYLQPVFLAAVACWAAAAASFMRPHQAATRRVLAYGATALLLCACAARVPSLMRSSSGDPLHGFATPAQAMAPALRHFKVVGSMQSGALTYYAPPGTRVVNLDGVVNRAAYRALRDGTLDAYMRRAGIEAVVDYDTHLLTERSRTPPRLVAISGGGKNELALYSISWASVPTTEKQE